MVDWEQLGTRLIERDWRPLVVISKAGRVLRSNAAFRLLFSTVDLANGWLAERSREAFDDARRALSTRATRLTVTLATPTPIEAVLELERVSDKSGAVMAVVVDVAQTSAPLLPVNGAAYELSVRERVPRLVRLLWGGKTHLTNEPCWVQIFKRATECPDCPVRRLGASGRATGIVTHPGREFSASFVAAERRSKDTVGVSTFDVSASMYSALVARRVEVLAKEAQLTPREQELLGLLLEGHSLEEAASRSAITSRTVKYHQQNLLQKLGVESRQALARLLL